MSGKQSAAGERALKDIQNGMTAYAAAKKEGIALSTIYRALKRVRGGEGLNVAMINTPLREAPEEWEQIGTDREGYPLYRLRLFDVQMYAVGFLQEVFADISDSIGRPAGRKP